MRKQIQNPIFEKHFNAFDSFIKAKSFKGKTFQTPVVEFLIWLERIGINQIKDVTSKEMMRYFEYLIERPNERRAGTLAGSTIKMHLLALSMFLDHLLATKEIQKGFMIPRFSADDQKPRNSLTIDEVKLLYKHAENPLEVALLSVGYGCGLRRSEMERLNCSDVMLSSGMLIVRSGKGNKRREVPMSDTVLQAAKRYVEDYRYQFLRKNPEQSFFLTAKGERMSGENLNKTLKRIIKRVGSQTIIDNKITLHCLRHSIAHHLMERNAGIDFIRKFLGHSFIDTAYIYALKNKQKSRTAKALSV